MVKISCIKTSAKVLLFIVHKVNNNNDNNNDDDDDDDNNNNSCFNTGKFFSTVSCVKMGFVSNM